MSDVMSVRLHLSGVRVRGVLVDSVDRLVVDVESTREWSRCRHCGFKCLRVWDRRPKRVRDLGVSGRRTTLVWWRRRFWCGNCEERHLEDHDQFAGGLTRRFVRRLVRDAQVMSIRAVARHHGVGWHRIMGLVRAHSQRVGERRRTGPCRVLLVDETSIRRRHRYVTVVACGDTGKILAMIPGRTKGSLARFFRDQGTDWCRGVEIAVSDGSRSYHPDHRPVPARRSPRPRPVSCGALVHRRSHPGTTRTATPPTRSAAPNIRTGPVPSPLHPPAQSGSSQRRPPGAPRPAVRRPPTCLRTAWEALQELYQIYEADDLDGANEALGRFADLYATGQIPEYHEIVDTIIAWGEEILAYHSCKRASNGPIEGINNLLQVLRRVAHRLHELRQLRSPRNPRNMNPQHRHQNAQIPRNRAASTTRTCAYDQSPQGSS